MSKSITKKDLVFHFLNVGFGDTAVIELPPDRGGKRFLGIVDCCNAGKTIKYVRKLQAIRQHHGVAFICATHPHHDHISGIEELLKCEDTRPHEFWDSGFRHNSVTYQEILRAVWEEKSVTMLRASSGMERYFGGLRITVLAPSVSLRNRYATYGVDMNNASIVLRFDHGKRNVVFAESERYEGTHDPAVEEEAGKSVVILGGDAEFDSWAHVCIDYPKIEATSAHQPLVKKMVNLLNCWAIKVSHHGSMHSAPLDVYERMTPKLAVISTKQKKSKRGRGEHALTRNLFPHPMTEWALREPKSRILTTDGSYEKTLPSSGHGHGGTVVLVVPPGGTPRYSKLDDTPNRTPDPPPAV
jgi:beta-lactamase superfamily II metal-dependent hydrolase